MKNNSFEERIPEGSRWISKGVKCIQARNVTIQPGTIVYLGKKMKKFGQTFVKAIHPVPCWINVNFFDKSQFLNDPDASYFERVK